ncbi:MAG: hypothetical protein GVY14_16230 [Spirochaetes bacterium]|nr:hypothetical protein [Spirochaetota bacterium]
MKSQKGVPPVTKTWIALVLFLAPLVTVPAADQMEVIATMQTAEEVTYREGGFAVLVASGTLPRTAAPDAALNPGLRSQLGWDSRAVDGPLTVAEFSYLVMKAFDIPGGLMYRLAPSPRYAVRELRFRRILLDRLDATDNIAGVEALRVIGNAIEWTEDRT